MISVWQHSRWPHLGVLVAVEHGVAEPDEVVHVGDESAAGPLATVVHVRGVAEAVVLVAHIIPDHKFMT